MLQTSFHEVHLAPSSFFSAFFAFVSSCYPYFPYLSWKTPPLIYVNVHSLFIIKDRSKNLQWTQVLSIINAPFNPFPIHVLQQHHHQTVFLPLLREDLPLALYPGMTYLAVVYFLHALVYSLLL